MSIWLMHMVLKVWHKCRIRNGNSASLWIKSNNCCFNMAVLIQDYYTTRSSRHSWKQMIRIHSEKWLRCTCRPRVDIDSIVLHSGYSSTLSDSVASQTGSIDLIQKKCFDFSYNLKSIFKKCAYNNVLICSIWHGR